MDTKNAVLTIDLKNFLTERGKYFAEGPIKFEKKTILSEISFSTK